MFPLNVLWLFASGTVFALVPLHVRAMSIANQDLERYFRATTNLSQTLPAATMTEERLIDTYTYAFIKYQFVENDEFKMYALEDDQARYGEGRVKNVEGKLVHITDTSNLHDDMACSSNIAGTGGNPLPQPGVAWIALVRRSHCTFEEKVRHVYEKGAIGVIIYNDRNVTSLEKMQIKGKNRDITAVITYHNVGAELVAILDRGMDVTASITQGRSGARPVNTLNRTSVLFVSVSFIVLMLISLVWLIFYYIQRFRYLQTKDQQSRQLCSVTKKAIMKIPTKTGKMSDEKDGDGDCCAVCIEAYKPTDCIRVLPCKHEFHKNCIDPWLIEHRTCPMCKLDVLKFYGYVVGDKIYTTPSPQHVATSPSLTTSVASSHNDSSNDAIDGGGAGLVPVLVVAIRPDGNATAGAGTAPGTAGLTMATPPLNHYIMPSISSELQQPPTYSCSDPSSSHHHSSTSNSSSSSSSNNFSHNNRSSSSASANRDNNRSTQNSNNHQCCQYSCNEVGGNAPAHPCSCPRRSSAPIVLEVSTASRQVTDV